MRQIGFRGKSLNSGEWLYGYLSWTNDKMYITPKDFDRKNLEKYVVIPETVGQYTGYNDCVGNCIYEGDIVSVNMVDVDVVMRVIFMQGGWKIHEKFNDSLNDLCYYINWGRVKVIGNMEDTPELFDGEEA